MAQGNDDPTFPSLHGRPAQGWLNDPNGLCRVDGRYHVFFQYNPDAPVHGSIAWGHASSADLLHWRDEPVALRPRPGEIDAAGCWSGCVTVDASGETEVPTAVYTAVPTGPGEAWATLARAVPGTGLTSWTQGPPVIEGPADPGIEEVRDPFVFSHTGSRGRHRYVIQGAGVPDVDGRPQLLLYDADDLTAWTPLGALLTDDDPVAGVAAAANIWECPNLFELDGRWVLLISLWRAVRRGEGVLSGVRYLVGDLIETEEPAGGLRFVAESAGTLDLGPTFYAPQVLVEPGRVLCWGWAWESDRSDAEVAAAGWAGSLTFPRELTLVDGVLDARPAGELLGLRRDPIEPATLGAGGTDARAFEVLGDGPVTLHLRTGDDDQPVIGDGAFAATRVLVDGSVVEGFGADGQTFTTRAYPTDDSRWIVTGATEAYRLGLDRADRA